MKTPLPEEDHFYDRIDGMQIDLMNSQLEVPVIYLDMAFNRSKTLVGMWPSKYEALRVTFFRHFQ